MKKSLCSVVCLAALSVSSFVRGGTEEDAKATVTTTAAPTLEAVPLDILKIESGYVFESNLNHGGSLGKQDELQNEFEYGHRFHLQGNFYVHVGLAYDRYDFGSTAAPVPNHLQDFAGVFGIDYMHGKDVGAFLQVRPGFYAQSDFGISSFDIPVTAGRIFIIQPDHLYIFGGVYASFLRSGFPVLPLVGVIWIPNNNFRFMGVLPDPRIIYSPNRNLDLYVGGSLVGGSFRTDRNDNIRPTKLNGAQVNFSDYRVGVGMAYALSPQCTFDVSAGCSIQRQFKFGRAGETYRTDPSPYVKVAFKAAF